MFLALRKASTGRLYRRGSCVQRLCPITSQAAYSWKLPPNEKVPEYLMDYGKRLKELWQEDPEKRPVRRVLRVEKDYYVKVLRLKSVSEGNPLSPVLIQRLGEEITLSNHAENNTELIVIVNDVAEGVERVFSCGDGNNYGTPLPGESTNKDGNESYLRSQYMLLYNIYYSRPVLSVVDGLAKDSGAALALSSLFTLATNTSTMVMRSPGSRHINGGVLGCLATLDPSLAMYLALTGVPLSGADLFHSGLADVYVPFERLGHLHHRLGDLTSFKTRDLNSSLCEFMRLPPGRFSLEDAMPTIQRCFDQRHTSVEDIIMELETIAAAGVPFARRTLEQIQCQPPLGVKVAMKQLQNSKMPDGRPMPYEDILQRTFGLAVNCAKHQTSYSSLEEVTDTVVNSLFTARQPTPLEINYLSDKGIHRTEREALGAIQEHQIRTRLVTMAEGGIKPMAQALHSDCALHGRLAVPGNTTRLKDIVLRLGLISRQDGAVSGW